MASAAIAGASGYSGQETIDRVLAHPQLELIALGSDTFAGQPAGALDPRLGRNGADGLPAFVSNADALASGADVLFLCLGHDRAAGIVPPAEGVVVDLTGAHRLRDAQGYADWYGWEHPRPGDLAEWCYSIPELVPPTGRLIANPGCYATAALLALVPLAGQVEPESVVIDAKSGVSGSGRNPKASSHAGAVLENLSAYKVGRHQHEPEIEQLLGFPVCLVTHLLPIRRGLMATCYLRGVTAGEARGLLEAAYATAPTVNLLPSGVDPELSRVQGTDAAEIGVFADRATDHAIVTCAIDNLGKGAAGQAVQNANLALGLPETAGLRLAGVVV
jgi:N-acetyl-gamma-glutamyl-phosphate reductase